MATVNAAEILNDFQRGWVQPSLIARYDRYAPASVPVNQVFTIPSTSLGANNIVRFLKFPAGAYIKSLRATPTDMDTHATPTLTYSLLTTDDADATVLTLVLASTNGQAAAGSDSLIAAMVGQYVGNTWLVWKTVDAAATAAAGTVALWLDIAIGVTNRTASNRGILLKDAEA